MKESNRTEQWFTRAWELLMLTEESFPKMWQFSNNCRVRFFA
ncbi:hypothetical protein CHCC14600_0036 [Bacillus licheniformis]|jgi:hypothetical protein|nr:hypothetical protein B4089_2504 [Bacillus licheniformis]TWN10697.1 hypothetical protein CHCC14564_3249 [Bacillus licheniformis LMG 17339]TWK03258.1 hypothetical protein CHCC20442_2057 [Bacillus licheniformis]TWK24677.1 hypothetical protein CHCC20373_3559 [Bacillus licheniformis]TWK32202.1 hypothetical protein CHCC20369_2751 [Bacillus licheniformis]